MKVDELRKAFLDFFKSHGHEVVESSSLVRENDPTLLFSNAGMNQFTDLFLGAEKRSYTRATTSQKCLRISGKHNDFENVGITARHHTFFEMLGNFSFGDYFKADAIKFGWEFVTETLGMDKTRLWVTIFEEDDEAGELWKELTDIAPDRVLKLGAEENFWAMGDTGPCGPCSEIHYYVGEDPDNQSEAEFRKDDGTYLEFWNLVFMQFDRDADGNMNPLPKPSVDTGCGLERLAAILQGVPSNYDTDLLRQVVTKCEELSGLSYDGASYEIRDLKKDKDYARDVAMRVITDHSRSAAFLIADGVYPGSEGRGYVLRRIIRRAVRHGRSLGFTDPFLSVTADVVISAMGDAYPELTENSDLIKRVLLAEEEKFQETLEAGLAILEKEVVGLKKGKQFPGNTAFLLHDTYGFPLDLTQDALKAHGLTVDVREYDQEMAKQRERSRGDRADASIAYEAVKIDSPETKFLGYETLEAETEITQIVPGEGDQVGILVKSTPCYAESGGQVGDTGTAFVKGQELEILNTQKLQGSYFLHLCKVIDGEVSPKLVGEKIQLSVDQERRQKIKLNHSATHLLHAGLRIVLGDHVKQAGSKVDEFGFRFDYSHFEPLTPEQLSEIIAFVNEQIRCNHEVTTRTMPIDEAKALGAMALFGEKYGDEVRVVQMGEYSIELCGGTHVAHTGEIGISLVEADNGISAGVRRIECMSGEAALSAALASRTNIEIIATSLKSQVTDVPDRVEKLVERTREMEREIEALKSKASADRGSELAENTRVSKGGVKVISENVENADRETLKQMVDSIRVKLGSGVVALGAIEGDSALIVAGATEDLASTINIGTVVRQVAEEGGGRGGGRADFAQAGGIAPDKLSASLEKFFELIE